MMQSQILFITPNFQHGGTNKSLACLLNLLKSSGRLISIVAINDSPGPYEKIYEEYGLLRMPWWVRWYWKSTYFLTLIRRIDFFFFRNLIEDFLFKLSAKRIEKKKCFSAVVAFQEGTPTRMGVCFSQYKIAWVHCCYSFAVKLSRQHRPLLSRKYYDRYDKIVCVSDFALKDFNSCFPWLRGKTDRIYNSLDIESLLGEGEDLCEIEKNDVFTIVSVGRLSSDKQFQQIPNICSRILLGGLRKPFQWVIIGSGRCFDEIEQEIRRYGVEDNVFLIGAKDNPYPYMKKADLIVVLSVSESWSYVLHEGLALGVPVLINKYPGCEEFDKAEAVLSACVEDFPLVIGRLIDDIDGCHTSLLVGFREDIFPRHNQEILQAVQKMFLIN